MDQPEQRAEETEEMRVSEEGGITQIGKMKLNKLADKDEFSENEMIKYGGDSIRE